MSNDDLPSALRPADENRIQQIPLELPEEEVPPLPPARPSSDREVDPYLCGGQTPAS